jgi:hypothetical protein
VIGTHEKTAKTAASPQRSTARELRKLSPSERDAILEQAAPLAENDELTAFEAFGKDDLHGDRSNAEAR